MPNANGAASKRRLLVGRFYLRVSLAQPDALLLEVAGSLRLFGGP